MPKVGLKVLKGCFFFFFFKCEGTVLILLRRQVISEIFHYIEGTKMILSQKKWKILLKKNSAKPSTSISHDLGRNEIATLTIRFVTRVVKSQPLESHKGSWNHGLSVVIELQLGSQGRRRSDFVGGSRLSQPIGSVTSPTEMKILLMRH